MLTVSGSKSQTGSGVPAADFTNKSDNVVTAPIATFRQKSGPSAALKVTGSHSSKATICARLGGFPCASACVAPANIKQPASNPNFATVFIVAASIKPEFPFGPVRLRTVSHLRWGAQVEGRFSPQTQS